MNLISILLIGLCLLVLYWLTQGAIYLPTKKDALDRIVKLSEPRSGVRIAELGSGDGRVVIALAKQGASVTGYEINPILAAWSSYKIRRLGLSKLAQIRWRNFWQADLSEFDVVVVFGMTHIMPRLEKKFGTELKPGSLVLSNIFSLPSRGLAAESGPIKVYKF